VAGTVLVIAAITAIVIAIYRVCYYVYTSTGLKHNKLAFEIVRSNKKTIYRSLEFLYKTCMYPLIFFSFMTIHNWHARILTDHTKFLHFSQGLAIAICVSYLLVTIYQVWWETIAKIHKI
jgi:hypothetical protein